MEKYIDDAIALCLEIQSTKEEWEPYGAKRYLTRERPTSLGLLPQSSPVIPYLLYANPTTPYMLQKNAVLKIIDDKWFYKTEPRPKGYLYVEIYFEKLKAWLDKILPATINDIEQQTTLLSKKDAQRQLKQLIKKLNLKSKEAEFLSILSDLESHKTKEFKNTISEHYRQMKAILNKKLQKHGWIIPDAKGSGYKRGYYQLKNLTATIE